MPFFAIHAPASPNGHNMSQNKVYFTNSHIFTKKSEALDALRSYKDARVREFTNMDEAKDFVEHGTYNPNISDTNATGRAKASTTPVPAPKPTGLDIVITVPSPILQPPSSPPSKTAVSLEKPPFRAPSKQELTEFRKKIESCKQPADCELIKQIIWDNPRYLVGCGDTPSNLKEGYRYNAMHICAQANKPDVAELILQTVSNPDFTSLYSGRNNDAANTPALMNETLLDCYLNTPDKGRFETPLHFAAKFGHAQVVKVLVSYPECKSMKNKDGFLPKDIICLRARIADPDIVKEIESLLDERYYVPVLRAADNAVAPKIGLPFSPNEKKRNMPRGFDNATASKAFLDCEVQVKALAGPMTKEQANKFCRRWRTPQSIVSDEATVTATASLVESPYMSPISAKLMASERRRTLFKDVITPIRRRILSFNADENARLENSEQVAEEQQANSVEISINIKDDNEKEHAPGTPASTPQRSAFLEYRKLTETPIFDADVGSQWLNITNRSLSLEDNASMINIGLRERHIKNSDIEKGLEVIGRQLAQQEKVEWREHWDFLDAFVDLASPQGLQLLENYLKSRDPSPTISDTDYDSFYVGLAKLTCNAVQSNICGASSYTNVGLPEKAALPMSEMVGVVPQSTMPYTCVEKSLQVFAKRITKTIMNNINDECSIYETLYLELKRLKSLICSFKEDERFKSVDVTKVHARISNLIVAYISSAQEASVLIKTRIHGIIQSMLSSLHERREHFECLCKRIVERLDNKDDKRQERIITEEMCIEAWADDESCSCSWEGSIDRRASRRKRTESYVQAQQKAMQDALVQRQAADGRAAQPIATTAWRTPDVDDEDLVADSKAAEEDDDFFSIFSSDDEQDFKTPPETPRTESPVGRPKNSYNIFIFGEEPTKRDLDVFNAIAHVQLDISKFRRICEWKTALESYTKADREKFPTPSSKKSETVRRLIFSPKLQDAVKQHEERLRLHSDSESNCKEQNGIGVIHGAVATIATSALVSSSVSTPITAAAATSGKSLLQMAYHTPINRLRGLFSQYRETARSNNSFTDSDSSSSPSSLLLTHDKTL